MIAGASWSDKAKPFFQNIVRQLSNQRLRQPALTAIPYVVAASLVGLLAVGYAKVFSFAEIWIASIYEAHPLWAFVGLPVSFLIAWWVVRRFSPAASGSGIPQLMAATELVQSDNQKNVDELLGLRVFVVKIISSTVCIFGGGAIGREGPTLQLAGSVFYLIHRGLRRTVGRFLPVPNLQSMIIAGGAAGLSAAFNTPLGGIVYAIEELSKIHLSFFRTSLIQAVIVAGLVAQLLLGPYLYLGYPKVEAANIQQMPLIILITAVIGICGAITGQMLFWVGQWRASKTKLRHQALIAAGCGFLLALAVYCLGPVALGSGKEVLTDLLFAEDHGAGWTWPFLRFFGNFLSYASGAAGGIFAPALSTGATLGSLVAQLLPQFNSHLLILLGMTAFLTGVTRTPFTSFVLVLEMTDRHAVIFSMMIAAMSANAAASLISSESLYEKVKEKYLHAFKEEASTSPQTSG